MGARQGAPHASLTTIEENPALETSTPPMERPGTPNRGIGRKGQPSDVSNPPANAPDPDVHAPPVSNELSSFSSSGVEGRYRIGSEIGRGRLGRVWEGWDSYLQRPVAIKELTTEGAAALDHFCWESRLAGQLDHPGIVPIYDCGINAEGRPFYVMKFVRGVKFAQVIKDHHALAADDPRRRAGFHRLLQLFVEICQAVAFAHSRGVVHRDLKPDNVMVGEYGEAIILDWGSARQCSLAKGGASEGGDGTKPPTSSDVRSASSWVDSQFFGVGYKRPGGVVGSPLYMSPEQARGEVRRLDERTDIFSLGVILYEILVGRPPVVAASLRRVRDRLQQGNYESPKSCDARVPAALDAVCMKALAKTPSDRFDSALEFVNEITRWQLGEPVKCFDSPWWMRLQRWCKQRWASCLATGALLFLAILLVVVWLGVESRRAIFASNSSREAFHRGQAAMDARDWETAARHFQTASQRARGEYLLQSWVHEVDAWLQRALNRAENQEKADKFQELRDRVFYHVAGFNGLDDETNRIRAENLARQALALAEPESETSFTRVPDEEILPRAGELLEMRLLLVSMMSAPRPKEAMPELLNRWREALALLEQPPPETTPLRQFYLRRAILLEKLGERARASLDRQRADTVTERQYADPFLAGEEFYRQGKYEEASRQFARALRLEPRHFWAEYFLAHCHTRLRQWHLALGHWNACWVMRPNFVPVLALRGHVLGELGSHKLADEDFLVARGLDPDSYPAMIFGGLAKLHQEKWDTAHELFARANALEPRQHQAYALRAIAYQCQGKFHDARHCFKDAVARETIPDFSRLAQARLSATLGDDKAALEDLEIVLRLGRDRKVRQLALLFQAGIRFRQGQWHGALSAVQVAGADFPRDPLPHWFAGLIFSRFSRDAESLEMFERFLAQSKQQDEQKSNASSLVGSGLIGIEWFANDEAFTAFWGAGCTPSPAHVRALRGLARAKKGLGREALDDIEQALTENLTNDPVLGEVFAHRGWIYLSRHQPLALADFEFALRLKPTPNAFSGRGLARALTGDWSGAIEDANEALRTAPADVDIHITAASIHAQAALANERESENAPPANKPQALTRATQFRGRACELLRHAFTKVKPNERVPFVQQSLANSHFDSLRSTPEFQKLRQEFLP